jgi:hypothetical protein
MTKDNKLISFILGCQMVKPSFDPTKLKDNNFYYNQCDSKIIDTSMNILTVGIFNYNSHNY